MASLARLKSAVRRAIGLNGGIDGAAATAQRRRSVAGDWNGQNTGVYPPLDCAFLLDEVAVISGQHPPILTALAAELGHVVIRLPECGGDDQLAHALIDASAEFGDVAQEVREATRDGSVSPRERERIVSAIDEAITALVVMRNGLEAEGTAKGAGE